MMYIIVAELVGIITSFLIVLKRLILGNSYEKYDRSIWWQNCSKSRYYSVSVIARTDVHMRRKIAIVRSQQTDIGGYSL